jgi:hypothetical protein
MSFKFTKLDVFPSTLLGEYRVEWNGIGNGIFTFDVEWSENESTGWEKVFTGTNVNAATVNINKRSLSNTYSAWFRVKAKNGTTILSTSSPTNRAGGNPDRSDYLRYREMLRRWNLELKKYIGSDGYLFRLRTFGEKADNVHAILGQPIGVEDNQGLGKKFKQPYWPVEKMVVAYMSEPSGETSKMPNTDLGLSEQAITKFYAMPYPFINVGDIWAKKESNTFYQVQEVTSHDFRGMKVKQEVTISRLPVTDPAHKLILP